MKAVTLLPPMEIWRSAALEKVEAHFNALALKNLHADLLAIALGNPQSLFEREHSRQELLASINAARTPAEITALTAGLAA